MTNPLDHFFKSPPPTFKPYKEVWTLPEIQFHDVVIKVDDHPLTPTTKGLTVDGKEMIVPTDSEIEIYADTASGTMIAKIPIYIRSIQTEVQPTKGSE